MTSLSIRLYIADTKIVMLLNLKVVLLPVIILFPLYFVCDR